MQRKMSAALFRPATRTSAQNYVNGSQELRVPARFSARIRTH
jgi:hypothetical protein